MNIILEFMNYRMYDFSLKNEDGKTVDRTVVSKNILSTSKGKDIKVKILNNEYCLELRDNKKCPMMF